jgi:hypothetical protein
VAHGAVADGTTFHELLSGIQVTVADGHLPVGTTEPGVAIWTFAIDPCDAGR